MGRVAPTKSRLPKDAPSVAGKASARTSAPVCGASTMTSWPFTTPTKRPTWSMEPGPPPKKTRSPGASGAPGCQLRRGVVLVLGDAGECQARHGVGGLHQTRAVEADARRLAAPHVGRADLGERPRDRQGTRARAAASVGVRRSARAGIGLGQRQHLGHVGRRVVVGVDGAGQVGPARSAVGAQEPGCRVDGVGRVIRARWYAPPGGTGSSYSANVAGSNCIGPSAPAALAPL